MTTNQDDLNEKIHDLVTQQLSGKQVESSTQELEELVTQSEQAQHAYIDYMQELFHIASRLVRHDEYEPQRNDPASPSYVSQSRCVTQPSGFEPLKKHWYRSGWLPISCAVAVVFMVGWLLGYGRPTPLPQSVAERSKAVATIIDGNDVTWESMGYDDLSRIKVGQELRLVQGRLTLVFDTGVEALVLGPSHLTIKGDDLIFCELGRISIKVSDQGKGFAIETPNARITDFGTEFGVAIGDAGQTEVVVFDGEVEVELGSAAQRNEAGADTVRERLFQGEATRISNNGSSSRIYSIDNRHIPGVRDPLPLHAQEPVIAAVQDNIDEGEEARQFYRIIHSGLREDCQAFVDRTHQWNGMARWGIPRELLGADYVMPFNDDKFHPDLEVEVTLARAADLYVFFSDTVPVPAWLKEGFVDTGMDIGLDEGPNRFKPRITLGDGGASSIDSLFSVWKREVIGPEKIVFGSVAPPLDGLNGFNMYGFAAVAKDVGRPPGE